MTQARIERGTGVLHVKYMIIEGRKLHAEIGFYNALQPPIPNLGCNLNFKLKVLGQLQQYVGEAPAHRGLHVHPLPLRPSGMHARICVIPRLPPDLPAVQRRPPPDVQSLHKPRPPELGIMRSFAASSRKSFYSELSDYITGYKPIQILWTCVIAQLPTLSGVIAFAVGFVPIQTCTLSTSKLALVIQVPLTLVHK
ncbi:hypothetical protein C8J57DRAFT_1247409 [Mycena rebaudengoi]|nr:hypothetical protein C8J57DRAFT_1247409 [Mycena rebaudengoi]